VKQHKPWFDEECLGFLDKRKQRRGLYRVLVGKPEGKRPLARPRCIWEDIQEVGCGI